MNKITTILLLFSALLSIISCNDYETYADQREKEKNAISQFISDSTITVISEAQFKEQGYTTNIKRNEYVLFETSGVYMQIVRQGVGEKIKSGEKATLLLRFNERNLLSENYALQCSNMVADNVHKYDKMYVTNNYGTFSGVFDSTQSLMVETYGSTAVPSGWMVPLRYINIGRQSTEDNEVAKVKLIVPASQGQYYASANVYPCYYEIIYMRGK